MAIGERTPADGGRLVAMVRGRRLWVVAFLGFFLVGAAWALAMPFSGVPDEGNYIVRAAGVGRGEIIGQPATTAEGSGAFQHVKRGLLVDNLCWQGKPRVSAKCGLQPTGNQTLVRVHTTAGRYPPAFFLVVGWPLALWPTWTGVFLARMIGAAMVSAFLASAMFAAVRWSRHRLLPAAVIVAVTPITLHISGGVNPNGVEIAAGLALMVGLSTLVLEHRPTAPPAVFTLIGISAVTLTAVRPFGPLWIMVVIAICFVPTSWERIRRFLTNRRGRAWLVALGAVFIASLAWTLAVHTGQPGWVNAADASPGQALRFELFSRLQGYATEMVGVMSWLDTPLPGLTYVAWFMAFGLLFVGGFVLGDWRFRWRIGALALAAFSVLVIPDALNARTYGFVSQGRYVLPIAVGLPILGACALGESRVFLGSHARSITRAYALFLVPIHLLALYYTMIRWQWGLRSLPTISVNPLDGIWLPRLGPQLPLVLGTIGVLVLVGAGWAVAGTIPDTAPPADSAGSPDRCDSETAPAATPS